MRISLFLIGLLFLCQPQSVFAEDSDLFIGTSDESLEGTEPSKSAEVVIPPTPERKPTPPKFKAWRPSGICPDYIHYDGGYGKRGRLLVKEILGKGKARRNWRGNSVRDLFLKAPMNKGGRKYCPNWKSMSVDQKLNYYVALFGLLARPESTCQEKLDVKCTGGRCRGELQIEKEWQRRVGKKRGRGCVFDSDPNVAWKRSRLKRPKKKRKSAVWEDNMTCAVQTMANSICGFHTPRGNGRCAT